MTDTVTRPDHAAREANQLTVFVADVIVGFAEWELTAPNDAGRDAALVRYVVNALTDPNTVCSTQVLEQIDRARSIR